jgi:hypothetical protein
MIASALSARLKEMRALPPPVHREPKKRKQTPAIPQAWAILVKWVGVRFRAFRVARKIVVPVSGVSVIVRSPRFPGPRPARW